jgi:hypothetical protein
MNKQPKLNGFDFQDQNRITLFNGSVSNGDGTGSFEDGEKIISGRGTSMLQQDPEYELKSSKETSPFNKNSPFFIQNA